MIGIGVVGYGYWGPNLARNFGELEECRIVAVCDPDPGRHAAALARHPGIDVTPSFEHICADPRIDAVAICTPVSTHFPLGMRALTAGKHVLMAKPLAGTAADAVRLHEEALRRDLVLMVDHTFVYTGAVRKMKELVDEDLIGELYYYDSVRINLGLFQHDVNVIWDLASHDLAIMDYLLPSPVTISAIGVSHIAGEPENIAHLTLFFDGALIGHVHVNWLAPVKVRRTLLGGSNRMIVYDDLEPSEKIKVYDKGIDVVDGIDGDTEEARRRMRISYRMGDLWAPRLDQTEALAVEARHFLRCIQGVETPITDSESGVRVVRLLEAATASLVNRGSVVALAGSSVGA